MHIQRHLALLLDLQPYRFLKFGKTIAVFAYGMTVLLFYVGMAIGPAIAGLYMQSHQISVSTIAGLSSYPSAESYNLIFLTAWMISLISIGLALYLKKKMR